MLWRNGSQVKLHDVGCCLRAYRADVVRSLRLYGELHRFLPALAAMEGASVCELPVSGYFRSAVHSLGRVFSPCLRRCA